MSLQKISGEFPIILVKNLPYDITSEELYELFGKFGNILQIRKGNQPDTRGSCFITYQNLKSARLANEKLSGYNFGGRYLVVLMYNVDKSKLRDESFTSRKQELENLKKIHGIE
ncbi:hypothetical protein PACTADRAFT_52020 [Pachysolen tannophilus NRRL Y-2460]|uniref:RRM domain-containing protein n=1 Tax=Pachysolen tannophilus NRRL Y-2460 TaxID=669874 RepID=A0A1E4TNW4_PACTA|nr:hypothetical protein PACTADRAFT_52020 [Pachysolen tannophilus NRRL Y-2460]